MTLDTLSDTVEGLEGTGNERKIQKSKAKHNIVTF